MIIDPEIAKLIRLETSRTDERSKTGIVFEMMEKQYEGYYWDEKDYWDGKTRRQR